MLVDAGKLPFLQVQVDLDGRIDGYRLGWSKEGRQESAVRHGDIHENLFGILLLSSEANLLRTRRLVRRVISGVSGHVAARKSEYFSSSKITEHAVRYSLLASLSFNFVDRSCCFTSYLGVFSRLRYETPIFNICRPTVHWLTANWFPRRCWLTPERLLTSRFSFLCLEGVHDVGCPVLFLSLMDCAICSRLTVS